MQAIALTAVAALLDELRGHTLDADLSEATLEHAAASALIAAHGCYRRLRPDLARVVSPSAPRDADELPC